MATKTPGEGQHRNDMYGDNIKARSEDDAGVSVPIPAATVVLMRQAASDAMRVEVLMLPLLTLATGKLSLQATKKASIVWCQWQSSA